uniref:Uroporphyrinogen decarboxylase (URO-D) domain-containing protein n=1 Tax=Ignisphaera aggregans TaxID=334771 RepID=A0A7C5XJG4_9CREN
MVNLMLRIKFNSKQLLKERRDRVEKVYQNKRPDRVPFSFFPDAVLTANYASYTVAEATTNYEVMYKVGLKWLEDFNVDGIDTPPFGLFNLTIGMPVLPFVLMDYIPGPFTILLTGNTHRILKDRVSRWPSAELPPNHHPQYIGGKFIEVEEYRKLAKDPIGFMAEVIVPRMFEALSKPSSPEAYATLIKLGEDMTRFNDIMMRISVETVNRGWPMFPMGFGYAPLDFIADGLRHPTHTMLDLRRHPEEIHIAIDALIPILVKLLRSTTPRPEDAEKVFGTRVVLVFFALHLNEMLPPKLFEEFYWPGLKRLLLEAHNIDAIPSVFFEGDFTPFVHYLLELPKGSIFAWFERADIRQVRRILGDHLPIGAGISPSLYIYASKEKIQEEICKLLNDVKEPGGFMMMGGGAPLPQSTKIENIWAAVEAVKKCGIY